MAVTCTNVTLARNTVSVQAPDAATANGADTAEVFTITPSKPHCKMIIEVAVADSNGTVTCSLGAGTEFWPSGAQAFNAVQNKTSVFHIADGARFLTSSDTILLTLTPATGKKLLSDHAATVQVIELP